MSKLTDDLKAELEPKVPCKVCVILTRLDTEDAVQIRTAFITVPLAISARVLTLNGHAISAAAIKRHMIKGHQ